MYLPRPLAATAALLTALGCDPSSVDDPAPSGCDGKCDHADDEPAAGASGVCIALRGNGPRIFAHFGALARIAEDIGPIDTIVGGSSASITAFLSESISMSPALQYCGTEACSDDDIAARTGFLFKSIRGYVDRLAATDEARALQAIAAATPEIQSARLEDIVDGDGQLVVPLQEAVDGLSTLFESENVRELINPELVELVAGPLDTGDRQAVARRTFHVADIASSLRNFGNFSVDGPEIFVRPGLFDFETIAEHIGVIGSFYAGYGMDEGAAAEFSALLDDCAQAGRGRPWGEVEALSTVSGSCGDRFAALAEAHWSKFVAGDAKSRLDDDVGAFARVVVTTSVLEGDARATFEQARATYLAGSHDYAWDLSFEDVGFGYIGQSSLTGPIVDNPEGFDDLKTAKATALGTMSWRRTLTLSPAEPGLARALEIDGERVSAGGWSDLFPVQALRNVGCETTVFVTGRGAEHPFQDGVARELGMSDEEHAKLYDLGHPTSAINDALGLAEGVWCTDWDGPAVSEVDAIMDEAYRAPLQVSAAHRERFSGYANTADDLGIAGCSRGVTAP